jgi:hypothetical protein
LVEGVAAAYYFTLFAASSVENSTKRSHVGTGNVGEKLCSAIRGHLTKVKAIRRFQGILPKNHK